MTSGKVCGTDGNTYANQCAALAAKVMVDYSSECRYTGIYQGRIFIFNGIITRLNY